MNCHRNHNQNNGDGKGHSPKSHLSHMLMMALCCGAPIIILLMVPFLIKNGSAGTAKFLAGIAPFICPLMMVLMVPMMFRGRKDKTNQNGCHQNQNLQLEEKAQEK